MVLFNQKVQLHIFLHFSKFLSDVHKENVINFDIYKEIKKKNSVNIPVIPNTIKPSKIIFVVHIVRCNIIKHTYYLIKCFTSKKFFTFFYFAIIQWYITP